MPQMTSRTRLKAERRKNLLAGAARLFADRGFRSVSMEDLGTAVGISGPAVYRHFVNKEAVLSELLIGVSQRLRDGGQREVAAGGPSVVMLVRLIEFHADFAVHNPDLIRVQDRDLNSLPLDDARTVRQLQRSYVETWVGVVTDVDPSLSLLVARTKVHAAFGLLNSTPHSAVDGDAEVTRGILVDMTRAALLKAPTRPSMAKAKHTEW